MRLTISNITSVRNRRSWHKQRELVLCFVSRKERFLHRAGQLEIELSRNRAKGTMACY